MDDTMNRSTKNRRNSSRRRNKEQEESKLWIVLFRQLLISLLILLIICIIRYIKLPATEFLSDRIKYELTQNIKLEEVYNGINTITEGLNDKLGKNILHVDSDLNKSADEQNKVQDVDKMVQGVDMEDAVPASAAVFGEEENLEANIEEKIDYGGGIEEIEEIPIEMGVKKEETNRITFAVPASGALGSYYGMRVHPIKGKEEMHRGIDIKANSGDPIKAALGGTVTEATNCSGYGNYIKIVHTDGFVTLYAHCSKLLVKGGQIVKRGEVIAKVGSTGTSTGPHLHFEVYKDGKSVNPANYIKVSK